MWTSTPAVDSNRPAVARINRSYQNETSGIACTRPASLWTATNGNKQNGYKVRQNFLSLITTLQGPLLFVSFNFDSGPILVHLFKNEVDDHWKLQMDKRQQSRADPLGHKYGASVLSIKAYAVDRRLAPVYCFPDKQHANLISPIDSRVSYCCRWSALLFYMHGYRRMFSTPSVTSKGDAKLALWW